MAKTATPTAAPKSPKAPKAPKSAPAPTPTEEPGTRTNPYRALMDGCTLPNGQEVPGILRGTVFPVLAYIKKTHKGTLTSKVLHERFNELTGSGVSPATFRRWCEGLGISVKVVRAIEGFGDEPEIAEDPNYAPAPAVAERDTTPTRTKKPKPAPAPVVEETEDEDAEEVEEGDDDDFEDDDFEDDDDTVEEEGT